MVAPEAAGQEKGPGLVNQSTDPLNDFLQADYTKFTQVFAPIAGAQIFVAWKPGPADPDTGKFPKWPINACGGKLAGWQKAENHLTLHDAVERAIQSTNLRAGVGVVFTGVPITKTTKGDDLYLVALDLDGVFVDDQLISTAEEIVRQVSSYTEISPSGKGIRILAYSKSPFKTARPPKFEADGVEVGFELFASSGFVTVTGQGLVDLPIKIRTKAIQTYADRWLAGKAKTQPRIGVGPDSKASMSEVERKQVIAKLEAAVPYLDTESYEDFVSVMKAFACIAPGIGEDEAIRLAEMAANNAPEICQVKNDVDGTNPAAMVLRGGNAGVDAGVGRLMVRAKRRALDIILRQQGKLQVTGEVVRAREFINQQFHILGSAVSLVMSERLGGGAQ